MINNPHELPVYQQRDKILELLKSNQVLVVQSPTGSGKTTQLPIILHEALYSQNGMIAVTQPRRIAALSVSQFIAKQLNTTYPGLVGYKMRFEDKTDKTTRIKIMTDGILLQEMKLDPYLHNYSVVMIDEAHERSLNIDFILGLLKRILKERPEFKVIISSATINTEVFSEYFDGCPIMNIDTITYPVTLIYDKPVISAESGNNGNLAAVDALLLKIMATIERIIRNKETGDILIFLPGERLIKECMQRLGQLPFSRKLFLVPLYGRLSKEEQERVFLPTPFGKKKVVVSTNIAETSVTIAGITAVIDSGLAKLNFYNPKAFTSSLIETPVSKASCNQRKGRAGRTQEGVCYRLYDRNDFESRSMFTVEEIYRTDLSEVILRMAELGITEFEQFDFISPPNREGLRSAIETLFMLSALEKDHTLSAIGKLMVLFPLEPRESRILVEAILRYPEVMEEALICVSFLSAQSPFLLPDGKETDARKAHHSFRHPLGDFVSYLHIFKKYTEAKNTVTFCATSFLDDRVMAEIANIKIQMQQIVTDLGIPILNGGNLDDYLTCVATGLIQFVCIHSGRETYRSLTAEKIQIHPGSHMFRETPRFIVAGEIVRTSRMYAMSVSPLSKHILYNIDPHIAENLQKDSFANKKESKATDRVKILNKQHDTIKIGNAYFEIEKQKGKKCALVNVEKKLYVAFIDYHKVPHKIKYSVHKNLAELLDALQLLLCVSTIKQKGKELGFVALYSDGRENYWFKTTRNFTTAVSESQASLESLIDESSTIITDIQKNHINKAYRLLSQNNIVL